MELTVRVHGALRSEALGRDVDLSLPEGATAGDLLERLAERFGAPFAEAAASRERRLPRDIHLFVGGRLVATRDARLAPPEGTVPVTVVLLSPLSGG